MRQLEEELRSEREAVARLGERERALAEEVVREKMAMQEMAELLKEARAHSNELPNGAVHEQQVAKLRDALADAKAEATATRVLLGQAKAERAGAEQRAAEASTAAQAAEQRASLAMREAAAARARETQQADPHRQAAQHSEQQWVAAQSALRQEIARLRQAAQQQQLNAARQVTEMQAEIRRLQGHSEAVLTWQAPLSHSLLPTSVVSNRGDIHRNRTARRRRRGERRISVHELHCHPHNTLHFLQLCEERQVQPRNAHHRRHAVWVRRCESR